VSRVPVNKTYKLFIGGAFVRSESGRTYLAQGENVPRASRKDVRQAVLAARAGFGQWSTATAFNRGQVLYRLAEMLESRVEDLASTCDSRDEVERSIDHVVWCAGWADKLTQVLGSANEVSGSYFNLTVPEPTGVVGVVAPGESALEGLVARVVPVLAGGSSVVIIASEGRPLAASEFAEAAATSDLPAGAVNVLTGRTAELAPTLASHVDVNALDLAEGTPDRDELERLASASVKRVVRRADIPAPSLEDISAFMEYKTVWHPMGF